MGRDHLILHQGRAVYSLLYRKQKQNDLIKWSNACSGHSTQRYKRGRENGGVNEKDLMKGM